MNQHARDAGAVAAIISGASRFGAQKLANSITAKLSQLGDLRVEIVHSSTEATDAAREGARAAETVVAVGGDGTVADVATGIIGSRARLGIVPAGSTNITARTLGIPSHPAAAIELLAGSPTPRSIDVGLSGDRVFLHIAGAGIDAELFRLADPALKRQVGWLAYLPAAASALRLKPSLVQVTTDDAKVETLSPLVLIANGGSVITPALTIHPEIAVDDGWLDVLVFTASTPGQVLATLSRAASRGLHRSPFVTWQRTKVARIEAAPPLAVQLDGDLRGVTPRDFRVAPRGLTVLTPPTKAAHE
jgi:diacylglycerol kinase family enzyme